MTPRRSDNPAGVPILIFGDHSRPSMRHEIPLILPSFPVLYLEFADKVAVVADPADLPRLRELDNVDDVISFEELGFEELLGAGGTRREALAEVIARGCRQLGLTEALIPPDTEAFVIDKLRGEGVTLTVDERLFDLRRRSKTPEETAGAERAQRAAQNGVAMARKVLREDGPQTSESLRRAIISSLLEDGCVPHDSIIVAAGAQGGDPHEFGSGPIAENVPILVDIYPRDLESGCWGDITRTLCVGEPPEELVTWHRDVRETQQVIMEAIRPGVSGEELNRIGCEHLAGLGYKTRLDSPPNTVLEEGAVHLMGHGVGLEVVEAPTLDEGGEELIVGDIVTVEPGVYRPGFGGCRLEDLVQVTEDGCRNLTDCPYGLEL